MRIASIETFLLEAPIQPGFGWSQGFTDKAPRRPRQTRHRRWHRRLGRGSPRPLRAHRPRGVRPPPPRRRPHAAQPALASHVPPPLQRQRRRRHRRQRHQRRRHRPLGHRRQSQRPPRLAPSSAAKYATASPSTPPASTTPRKTSSSDGRVIPQRLLDEARMYVDLGFAGMKTKVGGLPLAQDVRRVAALRDDDRPRRLPHGRRQPGL